MFLKDILEIYPIYKNIVKYITDTDIDILCNTDPNIKFIFNKYSYKRSINIYYDNVDKYISCLEDYERHKIFTKEICGYHITDPFVFLPKSYNKIYSLYFCENIGKIPIYVKKLNIYTNRDIDLYKLSLLCIDVEELFIDAEKIYYSNKLIFKKLKKLTLKLNIYTNRHIDLYKLSLVCIDVEELFIDIKGENTKFIRIKEII